MAQTTRMTSGVIIVNFATHVTRVLTQKNERIPQFGPTPSQ